MRRNLVIMFFVLFVSIAFTGMAMGQAVSDDMIKSNIGKSIQSNPALSIGNIMVDSQDGKVTLSGKVTSREAERQIVEIAKQTPGVKSVKSNLEVYQQR